MDRHADASGKLVPQSKPSFFSPGRVKAHFPIFQRHPELVYLDTAATAQRPDVVVNRIKSFYEEENANVHRGVYRLSEAATLAYETAREKVAGFCGGVKKEEIIFTSGTTEGINLAAHMVKAALTPGDEIVVPISEHHSNIVSWQIVAQQHGAKVRFIPLTEDYRIDMDAARSMISAKTKVLSCAHVSNVLGVVHPVEDLVRLAKEVGAFVVIDGAQAAPHIEIDVPTLGCDFYAFSGHKMMGPTGIGVLWGRHDHLLAAPPYQGGGDMIRSVSTSGFTCNELPYKFEAGTPPIAGAVGLGAAVDFLQSQPRKEISRHDQELGEAVYQALNDHKEVRIFCRPGPDWLGVVSFFHEKIHPHDLAAIADSHDVCIRAGHHCAQPLMDYFGVSATSRVSPYLYNTKDDVNRFLEALDKAEDMFKNA